MVRSMGEAGRTQLLWSLSACAVVLGIAVVIHFLAASADFLATVRYPIELDYGEGIVWQQFLRIPGPTMYRLIPESRFVSFHYPPVYYLAVHAMNAAIPDALAAGRAVSVLSALAIMPSVTVLVLLATRRPGVPRRWIEVLIALGCAALVVSLHPIRGWAVLMRVDTLGIALAFAGLALGIWADGRFLGTVVALLLCVAAVFAKQTLVAAGVAVCLGAMGRGFKPALAAGAIATAAAVTALLVMQHLTAGGFLENLTGNNINRFALRNLARVLRDEGSSLAPMIVMLTAGFWLAHRVLPSLSSGRPGQLLGDLRAAARGGPVNRARLTILLHFALCLVTLVTLFKSGSTYNYMNEWVCSGCVIIGIMLIDLSRIPSMQRALVGIVAGLAVAVALLPLRLIPDTADPLLLAANQKLVDRIAAADRPVLSDYMSLIMRAGETVYAEPSIVTELAAVGRWDERPLVQKIRDHGFAFVLTWDNKTGLTERRTAAVNAAIRATYPKVTMIRQGMWLWEEE